MIHPCLTCGACCAHFRIAFHWSETDPALGGTVPAGLTEKLDAHRVVMRGTYAPPMRCVALVGEIGKAAHCGIHAIKPSVCREVEPSWESGRHSPQCDKGRIAHGLPPLTPAVWEAFRAAQAAGQAITDPAASDSVEAVDVHGEEAQVDAGVDALRLGTVAGRAERDE